MSSPPSSPLSPLHQQTDQDKETYVETTVTLKEALEHAHRARGQLSAKFLSDNDDEVQLVFSNVSEALSKLEQLAPPPFNAAFTIMGAICNFASHSVTLKIECRRLSLRVLCLQPAIQAIMDAVGPNSTDESKLAFVDRLNLVLDNIKTLLAKVAPEPPQENQSAISRLWNWTKRTVREQFVKVEKFDENNEALTLVMTDYANLKIATMESMGGSAMVEYKLSAQTKDDMALIMAKEMDSFRKQFQESIDMLVKTSGETKATVEAEMSKMSIQVNSILETIVDTQKKTVDEIKKLLRPDISGNLDYHDVIKYDTSNPVGNGRFCKVFKGTFGSNQVAIKEFCKGPTVAISEAKLHRELTALSKCQHHNVVTFFGKVEPSPGGAQYPQLVLELGTMSLTKATESTSKFQKFKYTLDMLRGLSYVHVRGVVHGDIKPDNFFVFGLDTSSTVKLIDFSAADASLPEDCEPTFPYSAPEFFAGTTPNKVFTQSCDFYALGVTLFELWSGRLAYDSSVRSNMDVISRLVIDGTRPVGNIVTDSAADIISWMVAGALNATEKDAYKPIPPIIACLIYKLWNADPAEREEHALASIVKPLEIFVSSKGDDVFTLSDTAQFPVQIRPKLNNNNSNNNSHNSGGSAVGPSILSLGIAVPAMSCEQLCDYLLSQHRIAPQFLNVLRTCNVTGFDFVKATNIGELGADEAKGFIPAQKANYVETHKEIRAKWIDRLPSNNNPTNNVNLDYFEEYLKCKAEEEAKKHDPNQVNQGRTVDDVVVVQVGGRSLNAIDCLTNYLTHQNDRFIDDARGYVALAHELLSSFSNNQQVYVKNTPYTAMTALTKVIELVGTNRNVPSTPRSAASRQELSAVELSDVWCLLGQLLVERTFGPGYGAEVASSQFTNSSDKFHIVIHPSKYSALDCFKKAIELYNNVPQALKGGSSRAFAATGYCLVRMQSVMTRAETAFASCVNNNKSHSNTPSPTGSPLSMSVKTQAALSTATAFFNTVMSSASSNSFGVGGAIAGGTTATSTQQLLLRALDCNPTCPRAWVALGYLLTMKDVAAHDVTPFQPSTCYIAKEGVKFTAQQCFIKAILCFNNAVAKTPSAFGPYAATGSITATELNGKNILDSRLCYCELILGLAETIAHDPAKAADQQERFPSDQVKFTFNRRLDVLRAVLGQSDRRFRAAAYRRLARLTTPRVKAGETVHEVIIGTAWTTQLQTLQNALGYDPADSYLWSRAAKLLSDSEERMLGGLDPATVLEADPSKRPADSPFITVKNKKYFLRDCLVEAIQLDETNVEALDLLLELNDLKAGSLAASSTSSPLTLSTSGSVSFLSATLRPSSSQTFACANVERLEPTTISVTEALRIILAHPAYSRATHRWWRLVSVNSPATNQVHVIGDRTLTSAQICAEEILRYEPLDYPEAWWYLWFALPRDIHFVKYNLTAGNGSTNSVAYKTRFEIAKIAVERDQMSPLCWFAIGTSLLQYGDHQTFAQAQIRRDEQQQMNGNNNNNKNMAAALSTVLINADTNAGTQDSNKRGTVKEPVVQIHGDTYTSLKCFERCLSILVELFHHQDAAKIGRFLPFDFKNSKFRAICWNRLALSLCGNEPRSIAANPKSAKTAVINKNSNLSVVDCAKEALHLDPYLPSAWSVLGNSIALGGSCRLKNGDIVERSDCFIKILQAEVRSADAWLSLGEESAARKSCNFSFKVAGDDKVKTYSNRDCFCNALHHATAASNGLGVDARDALLANIRYRLAMSIIEGRTSRQIDLPDGKFTSAPQLLDQALNHQPFHAPAWFELALLSSASGKISRNGTDVDPYVCCSKALTNSHPAELGTVSSVPAYSRLTPEQRCICWALCAVLLAKSQMAVNVKDRRSSILYPYNNMGRDYSIAECWEQAMLEDDAIAPRVMYMVAYHLGATKGKAAFNFPSGATCALASQAATLTKTIDVLVSAIDAGPNDTLPFDPLAMDPVRDQDNRFKIRSLQFVPVHCWKLLCRALRDANSTVAKITVRGVEYDEMSLICETLKRNDEAVEYCKTNNCQVKKADFFPDPTTQRNLSNVAAAQLWTRVGELLMAQGLAKHAAKATVGTNSWCEVDCILYAIEVCPTFIPAWEALIKYIDTTGTFMKDSVKVKVGATDQDFSRSDCETKIAALKKSQSQLDYSKFEC